MCSTDDERSTKHALRLCIKPDLHDSRSIFYLGNQGIHAMTVHSERGSKSKPSILILRPERFCLFLLALRGLATSCLHYAI